MYKAVIIGLGNIAFGYDQGDLSKKITHTTCLQSHQGIELLGGYDSCPQKRDDFSKVTGVKAFESLEEMIQSIRPDLVSICTPSEHHFSHVKLCLEKNIPMIWLEKPAFLETEEYKKISELLKKSSSLIQVNYQRRFVDAFENLKEFFSKGELGVVENVVIEYSRSFKTNGVHFVDLTSFLLGIDHISDFLMVAPHDLNPSFFFKSNNVSFFVLGSNVDFQNLSIQILTHTHKVTWVDHELTLKIQERQERLDYPGFYKLSTVREDKISLDNAMFDSLNNLIKAFQNKSPLVSSPKEDDFIASIFERLDK